MPISTMTKTKRAKKMLVVEDQGETCLALDLILSERDLQPDYVNNLLEADEYLEKNKPSVILLDNKLPDGYGIDFISYAKKKYPGTKIIMITGFSTARDVAMSNGADYFLEKPFSLQNVNDAIDTVFARK
jgi:DNA-binding NtrC family response regulator